MPNNPPPENLRYPFGSAVPTNFRWKGKFTVADEQWWAAHKQAMESFKEGEPWRLSRD